MKIKDESIYDFVQKVDIWTKVLALFIAIPGGLWIISTALAKIWWK